MYFDDIFEYVGGAGIYQSFLLLYQVALAIMGVDAVTMNFLGGYMDHWCHIPALENFTHTEQKYIAIPDSSMDTKINDDGDDDDDDLDFERCYRFPLDFSSYTYDDLKNWSRSAMTGNISRSQWVKCDAGWVYDKSEWISTVNSRWDLVCDSSWQMQLASTMLMAGWLVGALVVGHVSDRFGRKLTAVLCQVLRLIGSYMSLYAPMFEVFCLGRFLTGLFHANITLCLFVIIQEITCPKYRACLGIMVYAIGPFSNCVLGLMAYFIRDYFYLLATYVWPLILIIPCFVLGVDESPRWLVSKGRDAEAIKILEKVARVNKGPDAKLPPNIHFKEELEKQASQVRGTYADLFKTPNMRKKMLIVGFCWFTASLVNYGLSMNVGRLAGNVFLNFILMALFDLPARLISIPIFDCIGRRWANSSFFSLAGVAMLACIPFILDSDLGLVATVLSIVGKALSGMGFTGMYSFTGELAPTSIRNIALGFGSVCARVSGMIAPFVGGPLGDVWDGLPNIIFGVFAITSACIMLFLPETLGHSLPETVAEAEAFGKKTFQTSGDSPPEDILFTSFKKTAEISNIPEGYDNASYEMKEEER